MRMSERVAPFAGIGDVGRAGLPVEVCASRVGRFGFVSKQLMRVQAARMPGTADWDFKAMIGRQLWECAVHWGQWRERVAELRGHDRLAHQQPSAPAVRDDNREVWEVARSGHQQRGQ